MDQIRPSGRGAALWAALLSLFVPGLGQVYARRLRAAVLFAAASIAISTAFVALLRTTARSRSARARWRCSWRWRSPPWG